MRSWGPDKRRWSASGGVALCALMGLCACGGDSGGGDGVSGPSSESVPVVRPEAVTEVASQGVELGLPDGDWGSNALSVVQDALLGTWVGGPEGLFVERSAGFELVDAEPVNAMILLEEVGVLVARADGLWVWDGASLRITSLQSELGEGPVLALAEADGVLWLATDAELFVYEGGQLAAFEGIEAVVGIHAAADASQVVLTQDDGALSLLRQDGDGWVWVSLEQEPASAAVPAANGRLLGLDGDALIERVSLGDGQVAWRPVALTDSPDDPGAAGLEALASDPQSGAVWAVDSGHIAKLSGASVERFEKPEALGTVSLAQVSQDGILWLWADGALWRVGDDGEVVGFATHIEPFAQANCGRCHAEGGVAHHLETYEQWSDEAAAILVTLEEGSMPADGQPLELGTAQLVQRWIEDGLEP